MELTILGVNSPYPREGRATLGYLVRQGETRLLVESGCGIHRRLAEEGLLSPIHGIIQSHLHYDHCADLPAVVLGATIGQGRNGPIPVFLPPGETGRFTDWLGACGFTFILGYLTLREMVYGVPAELDELQMTMGPAQHSLPGGIITFFAQGKRVVYTGDTGDCPALRSAIQSADLLLAEVAHLPPEQALEKGHLPARLLGSLAKEANVRELVVTHFMHGSDPESLAAEVTEAFGQPVRVAREGETIRV